MNKYRVTFDGYPGGFTCAVAEPEAQLGLSAWSHDGREEFRNFVIVVEAEDKRSAYNKARDMRDAWYAKENRTPVTDKTLKYRIQYRTPTGTTDSGSYYLSREAAERYAKDMNIEAVEKGTPDLAHWVDPVPMEVHEGKAR